MDEKSIVSSSSSQQPTSAESGRRLRGVALFSVLAALLLTLLLEALDGTIVSTALPRIIGTLQGFDRYTWVVTAYLLASITMIPIVGKLSDQFGRKWFLLTGTLIFLVGSALSGASQNMDQLIAFRAIQGLGAGIGISLVFTAVGDIFPPAERAKWQGIFGVVFGFSNLVGPTLGGWITDHGPLLGSLVTDATRWRWIFYLNLPLGILALAALLAYLPTNISERSTRYTGWAAVRRIDFIGAILVAAASICLLLGLTWGGDATYAWNSPQVISILVIAGVLLALFILAERFVAEPILPLNLFRNQVFAADSVLSLLQGMVLFGLAIYLPLFLQAVLGESATNSGAGVTPFSASVVVGASLGGIAIAISKRYQFITILGTIIMAIGVFLLTRLTPSTALWEAIIYMVITAIGMGSLFSVLTLAVQNALPRSQLGVGTGVVNYLRQLGQTLGVAIVGTVVNQVLASDIIKRLPTGVVKQLTPDGFKFATNPQVLVNPAYRDTVVQTAQRFAAQNAAAQVPAGPQHDALVQQAIVQAMQQAQHLLDQVFEALRLSLAVAIQYGFVAVFVFCVGAILAAFFLKDVRMTQQSTGEASESGATGQGEEVPMVP